MGITISNNKSLKCADTPLYGVIALNGVIVIKWFGFVFLWFFDTFGRKIPIMHSGGKAL